MKYVIYCRKKADLSACMINNVPQKVSKIGFLINIDLFDINFHTLSESEHRDKPEFSNWDHRKKGKK